MSELLSIITTKPLDIPCVTRYMAGISDEQLYNMSKDILFAAIDTRNAKLMQLLLTRPFNLNVTYLNGDTLLHVAIACKAKEIAMLLIKYGINTANNSGQYPIHYAAIYNMLDIVKLLILNGADITVVDLHGDTALHDAINSNNIDIATFLIRNMSIDTLNKQNRSGNTPLHRAVYARMDTIITLLIDAGVDKNIKNNMGILPMNYVCFIKK